VTPLHVGDTMLHEFGRPIGHSENAQLTTLLRNTHALHMNTARYAPDDITVIGCVVFRLTSPVQPLLTDTCSLSRCSLFSQALATAAAERDLRPVMYEELLHSANINRVSPTDIIHSMSRVVAKEPVDGARSRLEWVTVKTLGFKNLDVTELEGRQLPAVRFSECLHVHLF
jgi:hypothetical protein